MKARLVFLILMALLSSAHSSSAYENDIHYSATFAIAIAVGWKWEEAQIIASADQGVDENKLTIAALEADILQTADPTRKAQFQRSRIHQAEKNFGFHCFSPIKDTGGVVSSEVNGTIGARMQVAKQVYKNGVKPNEINDARTRALVSLGVALHCLQDSRSHNGYGGTCKKGTKEDNSWPGNCYGHTKDSAKDIYRRFFGKRSNPDHPAVRDFKDLLATLQPTQNVLVQHLLGSGALFGRNGGNPRPVSSDTLKELARSLQEPKSLKINDERRIECNGEVVASWLYSVLKVRGESTSGREANRILPKYCADAWPKSLTKMSVVIPPASYPRLTVNAEVREITDGRYVPVDAKDAHDLTVAEVVHRSKACTGATCEYFFKIRVSNLRQATSPPGLLLLAIIPIDDLREPFGTRLPIQSISGEKNIDITVTAEGPNEDSYFVLAEVQPRPDTVSEWKEADVHTDSVTCFVKGGGRPEEPQEQGDPPCKKKQE